MQRHTAMSTVGPTRSSPRPSLRQFLTHAAVALLGAAALVIAPSTERAQHGVVRGPAGGEQKRELGTSVAQVNVTDVTAKMAVPNVDALLNGRAAGVAILPGSGMIGAGSRVRIRGIGSFSLSADPLIYVDGIR